MSATGKRRRIAVFTSSRADLGPLGPVIAALDREPAVELVVIATGTHSESTYGGRLEDIKVTGDSTVEVVDAEIAGTAPADLAHAFGRITAGVSAALAVGPTNFLVLLGDRWELLAAASAALLHGVPIAHLHGGEVTEGAIDERIRHSVTKLADLHLCASLDSARRIRHLGEEPWRIVVTGAPGLDRIASVPSFSEDELGTLLGGPVGRPLGVVVYHPATADRRETRARARAVFDAAASMLASVLILYPGADPGSEEVIKEIEAAKARHRNLTVMRNLGEQYLSVLRSADVLIGNSSSGIIEAPSLHLPVVDIGDRQRGRLRAANVIHTEHDQASLRSGIAQALSPAFRASLVDLTNPYGDGIAARRITRALLEAPLDQLLQKPFAPTSSDPPPIDSMSIPPTASLRDAAQAINRGRCQIALVVDSTGALIGTISDGDLRRALLQDARLDSSVYDHMTVVPVVAEEGDSVETVLGLMQRAGVTQVPVVDDAGRLRGLHVMRALVRDLGEREGGT